MAKKLFDIKTLKPAEPNCQSCSLQIAFNRPGHSQVWGSGNEENPDVVFVGEALGAEEEKQGIPFIGRSGQLLRDILQQVGFEDNKIFITNICACRPVDAKGADRSPTEEEIACCLPRLVAQLEYMKPKMVVAVGGTAFKALTGSEGNITNARGKVKSGRYNVFPILHPAYVLRNNRMLELFASDIEMIYNMVYKKKEDTYSSKLIYVDTEDLLNQFELEFIHRASNAGEIVSFDFETNSKKPWVDNLVIGLVGFCKNKEEKWVLPVDHIESPYRGNSRVHTLVQRFCYDPHIKKVCHNIKYESGVCLNMFGFPLRGAHWDTMLAHYLFDPSAKGTHDLEYLASAYTHLGPYKSELEAYKLTNNIEDDYTKIPLRILVPYNGGDVEATLLLYYKFKEEFKQFSKFDSLMEHLMIPGSLSLAVLEHNGCKMDTDYLAEMHHSIPATMDEVVKCMLKIPEVKAFFDTKTKINKRTKAVKSTFNPRSNDQIGTILSQHLGYPILRYTATGKPGTEDNDLDNIEAACGDKTGFISMLRSYRELQKLKSTYIDAFLLRMDRNYFLHTNFNMHTTDTGRLSSTDPNFQNIPVDPIVSVKRAFKTRFNGGFILEADMSQMEVRMMLALCKDKTMGEMICSGKDFHTMAASYVYGVPEDQVTKEQRYVCKKVNWRLLFGGSAFGIHKEYKIPLEEAERIVNMYYKLFPDMKKFMESVERFVRKNAYYESAIGRIRRFNGVYGSEEDQKAAVREALNFPIQSIASDITLIALCAYVLEYILPNNMKSKPFSIVHDSIITDVHPDEAMTLIPMLYNIMCNVPNFTKLDLSLLKGVPIKAEMKMGRNWGDAVELTDVIINNEYNLAEAIKLLDYPDKLYEFVKSTK